MTGHKKRIFSGIQPSGGLTLGNYLGAMKRFVALQGGEYETIYCVVDMHAITVWQDPEKLRHNIRELAAAYLASGVDPKQSVLFAQSRVSAHAQLGWIFQTIARMGWMNRMTQFKDKAGKNTEKVSLGLYAYPALMAADILAYKATHVPVGEDQKQHVELTRDIAQKFNHDYGVEDFFPMTEPIIEGPAMRIMSLRDGSKKMSKSDPSDASRINLTDDVDTIAKKFRKATTDPEPLPETVKGLEGRAEARNLVEIYAALAEVSLDRVIAEYGGAGWGKFKPALADLAVEKLRPISREMEQYMSDPQAIDRILDDGAARAHAIAQPVIEEVFDIVGFLRG